MLQKTRLKIKSLMNTLRFNPNYSSYDYEKTVIFKVWCQYHEWYSSSLQWYLRESLPEYSSVLLNFLVQFS